MTKFKIKEKKDDPDWLKQRRVKKQEKYDKKHPVKKEMTSYPSVGGLWPEAYDEQENM